MNIFRWLRWRSSAELNEEIEAHIELEVRAGLERGLPPEDARIAARRRFGNATLVKERVRETDPAFRVEAFVNDVRHTVRSLARSPGFVVTTVLTFALAIGATTAIFTVVDAVLLRPLPFPDADRLVRVTVRTVPQAGVVEGVEMPFAELGFFHFVNNNRAFARFGGADVFAGTNGLEEWSLTGRDRPYPLTLARMTASAFEILGVPPQLGRFPTAGEDVPGGPRLVVLSDALWRRVFGADPAIVGRQVQINDRPWEVTGVMPASYAFPRPDVDVWIPFQLNAASRNQNRPSIDGIARLAPGETIESATADADRLIAGFGAIGYDVAWTRDVFTGKAHVRTLKEDLVGDSRRPLLILLGTTGFLLLIACSNVANLFQVRADSRMVDAAVRIALGSGRRRLIQYLLTEGAVLGLLGGAVGTLLAFGGLSALKAMAPASLPRLSEIGINGTVLALTALLSLVAGLLFAMLPALRTRAPGIISSLRDRRRVTLGRDRHLARNALVVAQVALALTLFVGSTLMIRSFAALHAIDPGFDPSHVLTLRVSPGTARHPTAEAVARFYDELLAGLRALPGVTATGAALFLPMTGGIGGLGGPFLGAGIEDFPRAPGDPMVTFVYRRATPGYFEAMGIPVIEGRTFTPDDHQRRLGTLIISKSIKDRYWPGTSALGKRLAIAGPPATIVGVVGDVHDTRLDAPVEPVVYKPLLDATGGTVRAMTLTIRTTTDPEQLIPAVHRTLQALDPDLAVDDVRPMQSVVGDSLSRTSFTTTILTLAAGIALFLGAIGIYGVMAYGVVQRTGEIGVRQALGASRATVVRMIVREGMTMTGAGIVLGLAAALGLGRVLTSLLYGVAPSDIATLVGGAVVFMGVAALASVIPVARAVRMSPATALRGE
jgi:putative ABC transport system permease protein